jgi:hypothetical protein
MALIPEAPFVRIELAIVAALEAVDWEDRTGIAGITVRHGRNRYPTPEEKPCVSVIWNGDEDEMDVTSDEKALRGLWDLQFDKDLADEESATDPTGWSELGRMSAAAYEAIADPAGPLANLVWYVRPGNHAPSDDSTPDDGRLVRGIFVVYRVGMDEPNVLFAPGENG